MYCRSIFLLFLYLFPMKQTIMAAEGDVTLPTVTLPDLNPLFQSATQIIYILSKLQVLADDYQLEKPSVTQINTRAQLGVVMRHVATVAQNAISRSTFQEIYLQLSDMTSKAKEALHRLQGTDQLTARYIIVAIKMDAIATEGKDIASKLTPVINDLDNLKKVWANLRETIRNTEGYGSDTAATVDGSKAVSLMQKSLGEMVNYMKSNGIWSHRAMKLLKGRDMTIENSNAIRIGLKMILSQMEQFSTVVEMFQSFISDFLTTKFVQLSSPPNDNNRDAFGSQQSKMDQLVVDRNAKLMEINSQMNKCDTHSQDTCDSNSLSKADLATSYPFGCFAIVAQCDEGFNSDDYESTSNFYYNCNNGSWTPANPDCEALTTTTARFRRPKPIHKKHHTTKAKPKKRGTTTKEPERTYDSYKVAVAPAPVEPYRPVVYKTSKKRTEVHKHNIKGQSNKHYDNTIVGLVVVGVCLVVLGAIVFAVVRKRRTTQTYFGPNMSANEHLLMCAPPRFN